MGLRVENAPSLLSIFRGTVAGSARVLPWRIPRVWTIGSDSFTLLVMSVHTRPIRVSTRRPSGVSGNAMAYFLLPR